MVHPGEIAAERHVDPVIIARCQIDGREGTAVEGPCPLGVAPEELLDGEIPTFRLDHTARADPPALTERAVDGAHDRKQVRIEGPRIGSQRTRKEGVEVHISLRIRLRCLGHIDPVKA